MLPFLLSMLGRSCPCFAVKGRQVRVFTEPSKFYDELCLRASTAQRRIVLSSLYLGTGSRECRLVEIVKKNLRRNSELKVHCLFDYCRGNRTVKGSDSTVKMLMPLVKDHNQNVKVSMYHTPRLRGVLKKMMPERYNETIELQHVKIYVFDDSLIISGANLSEDYFTNRQDRYILIENNRKLADFFADLIETISKFSLRLTENNDFRQNSGIHPVETDYDEFIGTARAFILNFLEEQKRKNPIVERDDVDTWIFPTVQMGPYGITEDSEVTSELLRWENFRYYKLGTGYFNLTQDYMDIILSRKESKFDIAMAHPRANGFYNAKGPAGGIPKAYTLLASKFLDLIRREEGLEKSVDLYEYQRPGWTFHAKGLWILNDDGKVVATQIGSSNFGYRSVKRDLEAQLTIVTENEELKRALNDEQRKIFDYSAKVSKETFSESERKVPLWVRVIVGLGRQFF